MVDLAVSAQLQQWTFEKPTVTVRPERSGSSASSPDLSHSEPETLRIDAAAVDAAQDLDSKDTRSFQQRYLSSEEDLSPMDANTSDSEEYDSDVSIHDAQKECLKARKMSISRWDKGLSCDMAVKVSIVQVRPKMIELANATVGSPIQPTAQRSASLAQLPIAAINKLRQQDQSARRSLLVSSSTNRSPSPARSFQSRRPSTGHSPYAHSNKSALQLSDSASSFQTASSTRSSSPSINEQPIASTRPVSAAPSSHPAPRSSLYIASSANKENRSPLAPFPPLTPVSPDAHSFLNSDPYETTMTSAASPIIKPAPHKRLRSISQKLSLARISITPSTKKWDSRINGRPNVPPTPGTPHTPLTPMTAPILSTNLSPMNKLRRNSRISSRPTTQRGPSPEIPPVPTLPASASPLKSLSKKLVARGANEREPVLELPPFPAEDTDSMGSLKARRVRKRKSLMDLL